METDGARNPTAILSAPTDGLLDDEKAGAVLLVSGLFLTLMGVTFTTMGWHHYQANPDDFEWIQLLGPILISGGCAFVLTSVCKFGIIWPCRDWDKEVLEEQTSTGHSFTLSANNLPTVLYDATAMVCFPPQYNFITQEVRQARGLQPGGPVNGAHAACPPYDAVRCVDNAAFTAEEEEEEEETGRRRSRIENTHERGRGDESEATCSPPPAYEDIYPSSKQTT